MLPVFNAGPFIEDHLSERRCHQVAPPIMHDRLMGNSSAKQVPRATVKNHSTSCSYVLNQGIRKIYLLRDSRIPNVPQAFVHVLDPRAIHCRLVGVETAQARDSVLNFAWNPNIILIREGEVIAFFICLQQECKEILRDPKIWPGQHRNVRARCPFRQDGHRIIGRAIVANGYPMRRVSLMLKTLQLLAQEAGPVVSRH